MNFVTLGLSAGTLLAMGVVLSYILGWASRKFYVEVDPRITAIMDVLPAANCGGCGYPGCEGYAIEVVTDPDVPPNLCFPGKEKVASVVAELTGKKLTFSGEGLMISTF